MKELHIRGTRRKVEYIHVNDEVLWIRDNYHFTCQCEFCKRITIYYGFTSTENALQSGFETPYVDE